MAKKGIDYSKGKIYKIIDNTNDNIYIGSTVKKLSRRLTNHRADYKRYLSGKTSYISSFDIIKNGDYDIILIEDVPNCQNIEQLKKKEREYIDKFDCVNKYIPTRTKKESDKIYRYNNKEKKEEYNQQYYQKNKDYFKEKKEEYNKIQYHCECGGKYRLSNKSAHLKTIRHKNYSINKQEKLN